MLGTLYVVISSSKEEDYQKVKEELLEIYPAFFRYLLTKNHKWKKMLLNSLRLVK